MIGIMDWGIGGLSVYQALRANGSTTDVLYFSDSGSIPYGKTSKESLRKRFVEISKFFSDRQVSDLLVACNAASSALEINADFDFEIFGSVKFHSIVPAVARTVATTRRKNIGLIGGEATINSGVYKDALKHLDKRFRYAPAQPLSAFVEAGELDSRAVEAEIRKVLLSLGNIDSLVLACTHYPALSPVFSRVSPHLELLNPAREMVRLISNEGESKLSFFTTGDRETSIRAARLAFGVAIGAET